ncbi:hypothetical protein AN958_05804 [Leucoagaricus sp. SymC.cos]|nr:hypothetical protein AN958_05804 [Leucoagaricus sp. SymC.cos]
MWDWATGREEHKRVGYGCDGGASGGVGSETLKDFPPSVMTADAVKNMDGPQPLTRTQKL